MQIKFIILSEIGEELGKLFFHVLAGYYHVYEAVIQQKFRSLKTRGEFLPDGLLYYARAGKTYKGLRLGHDNIA